MKLIEVAGKGTVWGIKFSLTGKTLTDEELINIGKQLIRDTNGKHGSTRIFLDDAILTGTYLSRSDAKQAMKEIIKKVRRLSRRPNFPWRIFEISIVQISKSRGLETRTYPVSGRFRSIKINETLDVEHPLSESFFQSFFATRKGERIEIPVFKDPSKSELINLLKKNNVRGMVWKEDLYIWDANTLHAEIIQKFRRILELDIDNDTTDPLIFSPTRPIIRSSFDIKRIQNDQLRFLLQQFPNTKILRQGSGSLNIYLGIT